MDKRILYIIFSLAFVEAACTNENTSPTDNTADNIGVAGNAGAAGVSINQGGSGAYQGGSGAIGAGGVGGTKPASAGAGGKTIQGGKGGASGKATGGKGGITGKSGAGGKAGTSGKAGATTGSAGREAPATCPATSAWKAGDTNGSIKVGGLDRTYILHVPPSYNGKIPAPLVIDFHGLGLTKEMYQTTYTGYPALGDQEGYVTVLPQAIDNAWNIGPCCTESRDVDDLAFARALVAKLISEGCIDWKRVYAVGYSLGGGFSHYLACNAADIFAAVAPAAFDLLTEDEEPCHPSRPITVISFRGTEDPIVYYEAHESIPPTSIISGYSLPPIHILGPVETLEKWGTLNGCTGSPEDKGGGCQTYTKCNEGVEVTLCTKEGGGHDPGDANVGWAMLKRHPIP